MRREHGGRRYQRDRAEEVMEAFAKGASERMWSTYWEVDHGLTWDHHRECWVDGEGFAYDGSRFGAGSRAGGGGVVANGQMRRNQAQWRAL